MQEDLGETDDDGQVVDDVPRSAALLEGLHGAVEPGANDEQKGNEEGIKDLDKAIPYQRGIRQQKRGYNHSRQEVEVGEVVLAHTNPRENQGDHEE